MYITISWPDCIITFNLSPNKLAKCCCLFFFSHSLTKCHDEKGLGFFGFFFNGFCFKIKFFYKIQKVINRIFNLVDNTDTWQYWNWYYKWRSESLMRASLRQQMDESLIFINASYTCCSRDNDLSELRFKQKLRYRKILVKIHNDWQSSSKKNINLSLSHNFFPGISE